MFEEKAGANLYRHQPNPQWSRPRVAESRERLTLAWTAPRAGSLDFLRAPSMVNGARVPHTPAAAMTSTVPTNLAHRYKY